MTAFALQRQLLERQLMRAAANEKRAIKDALRSTLRATNPPESAGAPATRPAAPAAHLAPGAITATPSDEVALAVPVAHNAAATTAGGAATAGARAATTTHDRASLARAHAPARSATPSEAIIELFSIRDLARIFALQESRLRYWMQTGFVGPTVRKGGKFYYRFADVVAVKAAKDLLEAGLTLQQVRKNLDALRRVFPQDTMPTARLRICSDGETIVALDEDTAFVPMTGQLVMAFTVPSLSARIAEVIPLHSAGRTAAAREREHEHEHEHEPADAVTLAAAPGAGDSTGSPTGEVAQAVFGETTEANGHGAAYKCFVDACNASDAGEAQRAEHGFRQALEIEPSMTAAMTNLGNAAYAQGQLAEARSYYENALALEPTQAEARYNLANLLEDLGALDEAIFHLRHVCLTHPTFADAHYNLGVVLAKVGGTEQARQHFTHYLELDSTSEWATHARAFIEQA